MSDAPSLHNCDTTTSSFLYTMAVACTPLLAYAWYASSVGCTCGLSLLPSQMAAVGCACPPHDRLRCRPGALNAPPLLHVEISDRLTRIPRGIHRWRRRPYHARR